MLEEQVPQASPRLGFEFDPFEQDAMSHAIRFNAKAPPAKDSLQWTGRERGRSCEIPRRTR